MLFISLFILFLSLFSYYFSNIFFLKEYKVYNHGIILLTGASTGIGKHSSEVLANYGYIVYAGVRKDKDIEIINKLNNKNLKPILLDVSNYTSCLNVKEFILQETKRLNLPFIALVNNAGISRKLPVEFHDINDAKRVFDTNYFGPLQLTQLFLPLLRESQGRIIMTSSITGFLARPIDSVYSSSKHALEALSDSLRRELAHFNISISLIEPAFVKTEIFDRSQSAGEEILSSNYEQMISLYGKFYTQSKKDSYKHQISIAPDATITSEAILHSITSPTPFTRYPVSSAFGISANAMRWLSKLAPDRLLDMILEK